MDEYANIKMPGDFIREIATIRSRRIYAKIFIQSISQLKSIHEKDWETIFGNSDTLIYLGSGEKGSYEYISNLLGEFTLNKRSSGKTYGEHGSVSSNTDSLGRKLMFEDEVRKLKKEQCIILLGGEDPILDDKYKTEKCPRFKKAEELGPYIVQERAKKDRLTYRDIEQTSIDFLNDKEVTFYQEMEKMGMKSQYIILDKESFLQLDLSEEHLPDEEAIKDLMERNAERIKEMAEKDREIDLTKGNVYDWLNWYPLDPEQTEEVIQALEEGMTKEEIRTFYDPKLSAQKMNQRRRLLMLSRRENGKV